VNENGKRRIIELSHRVEHGMTTYPGLPAPEIGDHMSRDESRGKYPEGTEFQIGWIRLVANTGTYIDTPFHRYPDGLDLSSVNLARLADVEGVLIDATSDGRAVTPSRLAGRNLTDRAVLIRTGWDRHWRTERYGSPEHPFLTAAAVGYLIEQRPALVAIDTVNIDDMADMTRPAHTGLLGAGIPILEHMTGLEQLPAEGFRFHAAPVPVVGMGSFPVRAYAIVG
jgi:kynurenine formamidase